MEAEGRKAGVRYWMAEGRQGSRPPAMRSPRAFAEAEARATSGVPKPFAKGDVQAINYFVRRSEIHTEAYGLPSARRPTARSVLMPNRGSLC